MKRVALFILLTVAVTLSHAQVGAPRRDLTVGVNGGVNLSQVSFIPSFKQINKQGIVGGVTARYISEKYFAMICGVQVEANLSQYGWKTALDENSTRQYSRTMNYIEVPFLAHLGFGNERGLKGFINAGPQISYLVGESAQATDDYFQTTSGSTLTNGEQAGKGSVYRRLQYGITAGAGVEWNTNKTGSFIVEGRYHLGLSDFYESDAKAYFERSAHRNIQIKATYLIPLFK